MSSLAQKGIRLMVKNDIDRGSNAPVYRLEDGQTVWRHMGDESVVLDLAHSVYFGLNRSAGLLWKQLMAGATRTDLTTTLLAAGGGAPGTDRASADVDEFLETLQRQGLVHEIHP